MYSYDKICCTFEKSSDAIRHKTVPVGIKAKLKVFWVFFFFRVCVTTEVNRKCKHTTP